MYGTPPVTDIGKIMLSVVAWNKDSYETAIKTINLSVTTLGIIFYTILYYHFHVLTVQHIAFLPFLPYCHQCIYWYYIYCLQNSTYFHWNGCFLIKPTPNHTLKRLIVCFFLRHNIHKISG